MRSRCTLLLAALMAASLIGCSRRGAAPAETASPNPTAAPAATSAPSAPAATPTPAETPVPESLRRDGERFEAVIFMEGMEETVRYEHLRSDALGLEMDYDYEFFVRRSEPGRERFISVWDDPEHPENYLEVTASPETPEAAAAAVSAALSEDYECLSETRDLDHADACLRIEASEIKGGGYMAEQLQVVYIIPAPGGCLVAAAHYAIEDAEGFGRRFAYMINTIIPIERGGGAPLTDEQALSAVRNWCIAADPELEAIEKAGEYPVYWEIAGSDDQEIVVLFRSYTGAQIRCHIERATGNASAELVPGSAPADAQIGERFSAWAYVG